MFVHPAVRYVVRRLLIGVIVLAGVSVVSFTTVYLLPSDPVTSRYPQLSEEERVAIRTRMGLEEPLHVQYLRYMWSLLHDGDLGWSYNTGAPVRVDLNARMPASLELSFYALLFALAVAVPLGIVCGVYRNRFVDHLGRVISIGSLSMPAFWVGLVGSYIFFYRLDWVPAPMGRLPLDIAPPLKRTGFLTIDSALGLDWPAFLGAWKSIALPVIVFGLSLVAPLSRITRSAMSEALQEGYVTFARAVGVPEHEVVMRDAFRGSQVALLTIVGYTVGHLIAGNALVEAVFSWPGVGRYAVQAVVTSDMAAINAVLLILAVAVALVNLSVDLAYAVIDPRVRHGLMDLE